MRSARVQVEVRFPFSEVRQRRCAASAACLGIWDYSPLPGGDWPSMREAMLTVSPTIVCVRPPSAPSKLTDTVPS